MIACLSYVAAFAACVFLASASEIHFAVSVETITPILTSSLVLRCSLNDTAMTSSGSGDLVGRDVTSTVDDVSHLVSLVLLRNGQDLATVSQFAPAHALMDINQAQVAGEISGLTGERGHLEVTLAAPGEDQAGNYSCEANGIDQAGHNIVFAKHTEVGYHAPGLSDVIRAVHDQDVRLRQQEALNLQLAAKNQALSSAMTDLEGQLTEGGHYEAGHVKCMTSTSWPLRNGYREKNITVSFNASYPAPPLVHSGVTDAYYRYSVSSSVSHSVYVRYYVDVVSVDRDSFVVRCRTSSDSHSTVYSLDVDWMSVPAPH